MWWQATLQLTVSLLNYIEMSPTRTRTKHLDTILSFLLNPFICPRNITICSPAGKFNTGGSHEANQTWFVKFSPESNSTTSLDFVCKSKKVINNKNKTSFSQHHCSSPSIYSSFVFTHTWAAAPNKASFMLLHFPLHSFLCSLKWEGNDIVQNLYCEEIASFISNLPWWGMGIRKTKNMHHSLKATRSKITIWNRFGQELSKTHISNRKRRITMESFKVYYLVLFDLVKILLLAQTFIIFRFSLFFPPLGSFEFWKQCLERWLVPILSWDCCFS